MSEYDIQSRIQYARERAGRLAGDYRAAQRPIATAQAPGSERPARRAPAWWRRRRIAEAPAYRQ
jgi:hypothetical protein